MSVLDLLQNFAFPIVCCVAMGWYILRQTNIYRDDVKEMRKEHREEISKMAEALDRNTDALQRLCERMDKEEK